MSRSDLRRAVRQAPAKVVRKDRRAFWELLRKHRIEAIARRDGFVVPGPRIPGIAYRDLEDVD